MNDKLFIRAIENTVPQHSAIYQLPYMAYPENGPINSLGSYDQARGHVHSKHLKWSFGGMRGREGDWFYRKLSTLPINEQVSIISAMGFAGVYIDRRGYLGTLPQSDHRCTTLSSSQIERLKNNCMTIEELEQRISDAIATFDPQQKLISQDHQLVFIPLPARASLVNHIDEANAYLLPIGFKLESGTPVQLQSGFETAIDLRKDDPDLPVYVGSVKGLAGVSIANGVRVGRWSDALVDKRVTFWLAKPLPKKFTLHIRAQAAGLNVGKPMQVKIGNQTQNLIFGSEFETKTIKFEVDKPVYKIEFKPADPFSPARRWGIGENRLIAILFQEVLIVPD